MTRKVTSAAHDGCAKSAPAQPRSPVGMLFAWFASLFTFREAHRRQVVDQFSEMVPTAAPRTSWRPAQKVTKAPSLQEWKARYDTRKRA